MLGPYSFAARVIALFFGYHFCRWCRQLVNDEVAAYRARLMNVVTSVSNSLELDFHDIVELAHAAKRRDESVYR